nr:hypothetical protein [Tanacetum cinerariifolium]
MTKPCSSFSANCFNAGDSLNLPDHSLVLAKSNSYCQAFNVKSLNGEIDCPKKSQVKLKGQIKTIVHEKLSINQECQDLSSNPSKDKDLKIGGDQKLKTSTLREIVSLEK